MENIHPALRYFAFTAIGTLTGVMYWVAVENLKEYKNRYILVAFGSLLLTPAGVWFASIVVRLVNELRRTNGAPA